MGLVLAFVLVRMALSGRPVVLFLSGVAVVLAAVVFVASPLSSLVTERLDNPHSNARRGQLLDLTVKSTAEGSPILGFGSTARREGKLRVDCGRRDHGLPLLSGSAVRNPGSDLARHLLPGIPRPGRLPRVLPAPGPRVLAMSDQSGTGRHVLSAVLRRAVPGVRPPGPAHVHPHGRDRSHVARARRRQPSQRAGIDRRASAFHRLQPPADAGIVRAGRRDRRLRNGVDEASVLCRQRPHPAGALAAPPDLGRREHEGPG